MRRRDLRVSDPMVELFAQKPRFRGPNEPAVRDAGSVHLHDLTG